MGSDEENGKMENMQVKGDGENALSAKDRVTKECEAEEHEREDLKTEEHETEEHETEECRGEGGKAGKEREQNGKSRYRTVLTGFLPFGLAIAFFFLLYRFDDLWAGLRGLVSALIPFIYGGVIAYLLRMPCNFFEKLLTKRMPGKLKKQAPALAIMLSLLSAALILYLLISAVVPQMAVSIATVVTELPGAASAASKWLETQLTDNPVMENYLQTAMASVNGEFQKWAQTDLLPLLTNMMDGFAGMVSKVVTVLFNLCVGVVVCIYVLSSRKLFARQARMAVRSIFSPKWAKYILDEVSFADKMFTGFFSGKILDSAIIGVICYVGALLLGLPNAVLISVIVGVTNVIPYFGPYIGAVPSALLILMEDPMKCLWFLIFIILLQQFDGNILGPRLLANSTGLSGFWVLFSITVFSSVFGFVGILIGVPVFAVIYDLIRKLIMMGLRRNGVEDLSLAGEGNSDGAGKG